MIQLAPRTLLLFAFAIINPKDIKMVRVIDKGPAAMVEATTFDGEKVPLKVYKGEDRLEKASRLLEMVFKAIGESA